MTLPGSRDGRTLAALMSVGIANHVVLSGSRVTVSLDALGRGASAFTVGLLIALYALLPMLLAISAGRLSDRIGMLRPMQIGSACLVVGASVPVIFPGLPALFVSAALVGMGFMLFQVSAQKATGALGTPTDRARNFSLLAMGYSISGFFGPLVAGFTIDHAGHRIAFAVLAALPVFTTLFLARGGLQVGPRQQERASAEKGSVLTLLATPVLRKVFAINVLYSAGWDLHTIVVPVYGAHLGLSASQIGAILSTFAAATFLVRLCMPALMRRRSEQQVLTGALFLSGAVYLVLPFARSAWMLAALSFVLGLGLGSGQPMVMSLLHAHAPPARVGEAVGIRMSLVQMSAVVVPLLFGVVGTTLGLAPVFWSVGLCLAGGGFLSRRR
ncbi:MAG: MFS transporter [Pseudomonadota bacterium]|nr:MFS transporter [Pseudomonadota bacterium]